MPTGRPDAELPNGPPPADRTPGPTVLAVVLPLALLLVLVGAIVALVALGGWIGLACGLVLMVLGVLALARYVDRIAGARHSPQRPGVAGTSEDLAVTNEAASRGARGRSSAG